MKGGGAEGRKGGRIWPLSTKLEQRRQHGREDVVPADALDLRSYVAVQVKVLLPVKRWREGVGVGEVVGRGSPIPIPK
jgi:hypothetical protein